MILKRVSVRISVCIARIKVHPLHPQVTFFQFAQAGGRTFNVFDFSFNCSLYSRALDHSTTTPTKSKLTLVIRSSICQQELHPFVSSGIDGGGKYWRQITPRRKSRGVKFPRGKNGSKSWRQKDQSIRSPSSWIGFRFVIVDIDVPVLMINWSCCNGVAQR